MNQGHPFRKYQALGNDYIVIDPAHNPVPIHPATVRLLCERHFGIGSDGILWGPAREPDGFAFRIFNPDGSEAERSGNGLRIFARYLHDAGYVDGDEGVMRTRSGPARFRYLDDDASLIRVEMGRAAFLADANASHATAEELCVGDDRLSIVRVSMGNPHCVVVSEAPSEALARRLGPVIERHALFPEGTNVQFARPLGRSAIDLQIWERGAGYTLSSGTSSCAAAVALRGLDLVDAEVEVRMPGGQLTIGIAPDWMVEMTGDVSATFSGNLSRDLVARLAALSSAGR